MNLKTVGGLLLSLSLGVPAFATGFTPIAIDTNSFNEDVVVEASAPQSLNDVVTATMDGGTNKTGNTFYEIGYNPAAPLTGLPAHGSVVTNLAGDHAYLMPADYHVNDAIMVGHNNGGKTPLIPNGTLTLTTPATFAGLSFLTAAGNGPVTVGYVIHYADSSTDSGTFSAVDWFGAGNLVKDVSGRVSLGGGVQNVNVGDTNVPAIWSADVPANSAINVMSVDFYYVTSGGTPNTNNSGRAVVFAISGATSGNPTLFTNTLAVSGFNQSVVVPADAPQTTGTGVASAGELTNYVTFTMDGGVSKANNCWFEQGYCRDFPTLGIPTAGSTFSSAAVPATYTMPATYATNDAVCLDKVVTNATITLATPAAYGALSFLCAAANGDTIVPCVIHYQDGSSETNAILAPDWYNRNVPEAYLAFGRVLPSNHTLNNTLPEFVSPFALPLGSSDFRGLGLPVGRLFDAVVNLANPSGTVTSISLNYTNGVSGRTVAIFAVSGAAANNVPPVLGEIGTTTPGQPTFYYSPSNAVRAVLSTVNRANVYQGSPLSLSVSNIAGTGPITYQWRRAPLGGGLHDELYSIDYGTFANLTDGGTISGSGSSVLTISPAALSDSADYLCVLSNPYGSVTSLVATVMIMTTNQNVLSGVPAGDVITALGNDSTPAAESLDHVIDQAAQKWLSDGLQWNGACCGGPTPFIGYDANSARQVGFTVTPIAGSSIVTSVRIFTANDTTTRDPLDFTLEGSNDGVSFAALAHGVLKGTLSLPTGRNGTGSAGLDPILGYASEIDFANAVGYKMYRYSLTNIYDDLGTPLMQVAEVQLLGTLVPNPPVWVRQPESSVTVFVGGSPTFTVDATGYPLPHYQWYKNGTTLVGTGASFTYTNAQLSDQGTTFDAVAINTFGQITSSSVTLNVIAAPTQSYPSAVLADSPKSYWRLDEGPDNGLGNDGTTAHDYMGGHDGYYSNAVIAVAGYNPSSDPDTAAQFGSFAQSDSYVANIFDVDFARRTNANTGGQFSVEAWVNGGAQPTNSGIVAKGYDGALLAGTGTGTEQYALDINKQAFRFLVRDATGNGYVALGAKTTDGNWHHLVGVCDQPNGQVELYVDGLLAASTTIPPNAGILDQPLPTSIGARQSGGANDFDEVFIGVVDDVAIYSTALSASQVLNHYYAADRAPVFTLTPTNTTVANNTTASFYSSAYGPGTVTYQWYLSDGSNPTTPVAGAVSSNYIFTATTAQANNLYQVIARDAFGSVTSAPVLLTVISGAPLFLNDLPASQTVYKGHYIQLHVFVGGDAPFTYTWTKNGVTINNDYRTSGAQSDTLTIGYADFSDTGNYQVTAMNGSGTTPSTVDAITVTNNTSGFFGAGATTAFWQLNNGAGNAPQLYPTNAVQLTWNLGSTANSAFLKTPVNITAFHALFTYQAIAPTLTSTGGGADGVSFCIQNDPRGASAVGGGGGSLGVSGITPSVELQINIYNGHPYGIEFQTGGTVDSVFVSLAPIINFGQNNNPVLIDANYSANVMTLKFTDQITAASFTTNWSINIPQTVGGNTAYVGFTGADGGVASSQIISWGTGGSGATRIPLTAQVVGPNLVLSWPASAGAFLMNASNLTTPVTWAQDTDPWQIVGSQAQVTVPVSAAGDKFFRLQLEP
ncbi:MAG TPA: immunoglobulin domain-containing protein [Verrucomicrobiae bacterium]|nr:immunoglobulin domain-containing protein [Verrucomicrobiae bacterium]